MAQKKGLNSSMSCLKQWQQPIATENGRNGKCSETALVYFPNFQ